MIGWSLKNSKEDYFKNWKAGEKVDYLRKMTWSCISRKEKNSRKFKKQEPQPVNKNVREMAVPHLAAFKAVFSIPLPQTLPPFLRAADPFRPYQQHPWTQTSEHSLPSDSVLPRLWENKKELWASEKWGCLLYWRNPLDFRSSSGVILKNLWHPSFVSLKMTMLTLIWCFANCLACSPSMGHEIELMSRNQHF